MPQSCNGITRYAAKLLLGAQTYCTHHRPMETRRAGKLHNDIEQEAAKTRLLVCRENLTRRSCATKKKHQGSHLAIGLLISRPKAVVATSMASNEWQGRSVVALMLPTSTPKATRAMMSCVKRAAIVPSEMKKRGKGEPRTSNHGTSALANVAMLCT